MEPMFEIPGSDISSVVITEEVVQGKEKPLYTCKDMTSENASQEEDYDSRNNQRAFNT